MINAKKIAIDEVIHSRTNGNTIERACIDESLTAKCIKYHNDQWFTFTTDTVTQLFINIAGQKCRDLLGVQLVVLEGTLCQPDTYTVLDCISLATQDDVYTTLNNLKQHQKYWINIDGYLHDYCHFELEVSSEPKGFSAEKTTILSQISGTKNKNLFTIKWSLPDSSAHNFGKFKIYRRPQGKFKFSELCKLPIEYNALGEFKSDYQYTDTVYNAGAYFYRIIIESNEGQDYFVEELAYKVQPQDLRKIALSLDYELNTKLLITVINEANNQVLETIEFFYDPRRHSSYQLYIERYLANNIKSIKVVVLNKKESHVKSYYFRL